MPYDPREDPVVKEIFEAKSEKERKAIEKEVVVDSVNGPKPTDPKGKVSQAKKPRS